MSFLDLLLVLLVPPFLIHVNVGENYDNIVMHAPLLRLSMKLWYYAYSLVEYFYPKYSLFDG